MNRKFCAIFFAIPLIMLGSGCGTRPKELQPPSGPGTPKFPSTYPKAKSFEPAPPNVIIDP